jgi:plasmid stabilization system protein ParE
MRDILWSPESLEDSRQIYQQSILHFGETQTIKHFTKIYNSIENLRHFPHLGVVKPIISAKVRMLTIYPHIIFYAVSPTQIEILRLFDGRQDISAL